jgi:hypothetical protein
MIVPPTNTQETTLLKQDEEQLKVATPAVPGELNIIIDKLDDVGKRLSQLEAIVEKRFAVLEGKI